MSIPNPESAWKQEVSQRIAAHQRRRSAAVTTPAAPAPSRHGAGSRAAEAAARVAARYAQAPSYSQTMEMETPAVARGAESAAMREAERDAAFEFAAPVEVESAFAFEATVQQEIPAIEHMPKAEMPRAAGPSHLNDWSGETGAPLSEFRGASRGESRFGLVAPESLEAWENESQRNRWEPDPRLLPLRPAVAVAPRRVEVIARLDKEDRPRPRPELAGSPWSLEGTLEETLEESLAALEPVEPMQAIYANLIEFPRELVAARKMRPRRVEGPFALLSQEKQLSIFEVDPGAISMEPDAAGEAPTAAREETDWRGIELEPQANEEGETQETPAVPLALELGSVRRRLGAVLVDGAIVAAIGLGSAMAAAPGLLHRPPARIVELGAAAAVVLIGLVYQTLFLALAGATPGMRSTRLSLCTFDGRIPTGSEIRSRLGAMLLSVAPLGLGVAWALFDDDRLCWHDRLSRTYPRVG
ncbi:MAG: RDD family protein [Terracidiphilus sp.]